MALSYEHLKTLHDRGEELASLLPYYDYDPEGQVFIQVDGRLGVGWKIEPVPSDTDTDESRSRLAELVEKVLLEIPPEFAGQWILEVSRDVEDTLDRFISASDLSGRGLLKLLCEGKRERYRAATAQGFWKGNPYRCRAFSTYLFLISPKVAGLPAGPLAWIARGRSSLVEEAERKYLERKADLIRQALAVERGFEGYGFKPQRLDLTGLLGIVYRTLNPGRAEKFRFGNRPENGNGMTPPFVPDGRPLREQVVFGDCSVQGDHLQLDGRHTRVFSLTGLPGSVSPGLINTLLERYTGDLLVTINFVNLSLADSRGTLGVKRFLAGRQAKSITGQENLSAKVILEELDEVLREIESHNRRMVCFSVHAVASTPAEKHAEATDAILRAFSFVGATATIETAIALPALLSSLPLAFDPKLDNYMRRLRKVLSDRFVMFCPLWGYFRGTRSPTQLYLTRQGVPITLDPMDCDTSPHGVILATSGAGKSFFTNDMLIQAQRLDPRPFVFIIDVGGSYQKLCEMLDGDYAQIQLRSPTCVNPFAEELSDSSVALWVPLLAQMVRDPESAEPVTREQKVLFELALRGAFERKAQPSPSPLPQAGEGGDAGAPSFINSSSPERSAGGRRPGEGEVFLSDIVAELKKQGALGESLALKLYPFTRQGRFGVFFDGPTKLRIGNRFMVFDLTEAKDQVELRGPLMMAVMNLIIRIVREENLRGTRKYLMIDEAWAFLKDPAAAEFIKEGYKTFRKYSGLVFVITQDVLDLVQFPAGEAILSNAPNVFLLKQQAKALEALGKHLHLSENQVRTIQSVHMRKGYYSEAYVMTTFEGATRDGVIRVVPDAISYWVSTTDGADVQAFHEELKETGDKVEAIRRLAERFPMGVGAAR